jgi:acetyl esterase/lipase
MVPVHEGRCFAEALRQRSRQVVAYAEIPGAQHAFEVFRSVRALEAIAMIGDFLDAVRSRRATPAVARADARDERGAAEAAGAVALVGSRAS